MFFLQVRAAVSDILKVEHDLFGMVFEHEPAESQGTLRLASSREEVELLMEAYNSDLKEIECELKNIRCVLAYGIAIKPFSQGTPSVFRHTIEDTNDFINIHLNSIRNRIIKMSLFMEMGTMAIGCGALTAGIFGMNLTHGFESHPTAFYVTCGGIGLAVGSMFGIFSRRFAILSLIFNVKY